MTNWRKSSRSGLSACLWVWPGKETMWVKDENKTVLVVWNKDWHEFIEYVKANG